MNHLFIQSDTNTLNDSNVLLNCSYNTTSNSPKIMTRGIATSIEAPPRVLGQASTTQSVGRRLDTPTNSVILARASTQHVNCKSIHCFKLTAYIQFALELHFALLHYRQLSYHKWYQDKDQQSLHQHWLQSLRHEEHRSHCCLLSRLFSDEKKSKLEPVHHSALS